MLRIKHTKCQTLLSYIIFKNSDPVGLRGLCISLTMVKNKEELLKYIIQGYRYAWCSSFTGCGTVVEPSEWEIIDE